MEKSAKKNVGQFLAVMEANKGILYKVANAYCHNLEDRKDLVQEIQVRLWQSFEKYNSQYKYSTWIYRIALNTAISFYRKENRRKGISSPVTDGVIHIAEVSNEEADLNIVLLQQFISELRELDRALLLLYLEEKSHKEIAEILGISETNVATRVGRIKAVLKEKFTTGKSK